MAGEAGIGKSRLCHELVGSDPAESAISLVGEADQDSWRLPLGPVVDSLRGGRQAGVPHLWASLAERHRWIGAVLPELVPESTARRKPIDRQLVIEMLLEAVGEAARESPLVWVLDNMHCADPTSWDFVRQTSRRIARLPIVLVVAYRPQEVMAENAAAILSRLVLEPSVVALTLGRLVPNDATLLAREVAPADAAPDLLDSIAARSLGNPAVLIALATHGKTTTAPHYVRGYARSRTASLSPNARAVLEWLAVTGEAPMELLRALDADAAESGVPELLMAGLASEIGGNRLRCEFPMFADAIYEDMSWSRRRAVHSAVADALDGVRGGPHGDVRERARHRELSGAPDAAFRELVAAAAAARKEGRTGVAAELGVAAFELTRRHEDWFGGSNGLWGEVIDDLSSAGHWVEVLGVGRRLWADGGSAKHPLRGTLEPALSIASVMTGQVGEAWNPLRTELARLEAVGRAAGDSHASPDLRWHEQCDDISRRLRNLASEGGMPGIQRQVACLDHLIAFWHHRDRERSAVSYLMEARRAEEEGLGAMRAFALVNRARMTTRVDHALEAEAVGDYSDSWAGSLSRLLLGTLHILEGSSQRAADALDRCLSEIPGMAPLLEPVVSGLRAHLLIQDGALDAARCELDRWTDSDFPGRSVWAVLSGAAGWLAWRENDIRAAAHHLGKAAAESALTGYGPCESGPLLLPLHVDALLRLDRREDAEETLRHAVETHWHPDRFFSAAIAMARFRLQPTAESASEARRRAMTAPWPYMAELAERWQQEFAARTRQLNPQHAHRELSSRELEIGELIAQGLTNQAIAYRLHVSPYTVGTHVKNAMSKLQFSSRSQLAAWIREQAQVAPARVSIRASASTLTRFRRTHAS